MNPPLPPPEPLFDAIGRVAYAAATMEIELSRLLVAMLHAPIAGVAVIGENFAGVHRQVKAISKLPTELQPYDVARRPLTTEQQREVKEILDASERLNGRRNWIVHGLWKPTEDPAVWINAKPERYKLATPEERLTLEQVHDVARQALALAGRIERLTSDVDPTAVGST